MKEHIVLFIYRILMPLLFLVAFPGWILKMIRRGGFGTALNERIGVYFTGKEFEPSGAVHLHAVSVGETILALKHNFSWPCRAISRNVALVATHTAVIVIAGAALVGTLAVALLREAQRVAVHRLVLQGLVRPLGRRQLGLLSLPRALGATVIAIPATAATTVTTVRTAVLP